MMKIISFIIETFCVSMELIFIVTETFCFVMEIFFIVKENCCVTIEIKDLTLEKEQNVVRSLKKEVF